MKILGIDASGMVASVAIVEDDIVVGEYSTNFKKTHSQTLLPMLEELKKMIALDLDTIDAIAVAAGPGSLPDSVSVRRRQRDWDLLWTSRSYPSQRLRRWLTISGEAQIMCVRSWMQGGGRPIPVFITLRIQRWSAS